MKSRNLWLNKVHAAWDKRPIAWLSGVRRVGKTTLARQIPDSSYYNCDLPSVQQRLENPEFFYANQDNKVLILDEVQNLENPSQLLKIAADEFSNLKILATGSSTLEATKKFSDTLTGRKLSIYMAPVLWRECLTDFAIPNFEKRLLLGGLPSVLLEKENRADFFEEWMASFFARDIQELFGFRDRSSFIKCLQTLCLQSGGQLNMSDLAKAVGVSRPTVISQLDAMEIAHAIYRLPPYHGGGQREFVKQPKCYIFDTGLVTYVQGWQQLRIQDQGHLWEHLVLDELRFIFPDRYLHYWRTKSQHEIDFIVEKKPGIIDVVEAKMNPDGFNPKSLKIFREYYPQGQNYIVIPHCKEPYQRVFQQQVVTICRPDHIERLNIK